MGFSTHSLTGFLDVFIFEKVFGVVAFSEFSEPALFLAEDAFGGSGNPGLVKFARAHFGRNIDIEKKK